MLSPVQCDEWRPTLPSGPGSKRPGFDLSETRVFFFFFFCSPWYQEVKVQDYGACTQEIRSNHCLHWKKLSGFSLFYSSSDGPWRIISPVQNVLLTVVQRLLVACSCNCTRVDSAFLSQSLSRTAWSKLLVKFVGFSCERCLQLILWVWTVALLLLLWVFSSTRKSAFLMTWRWHVVIWM